MSARRKPATRARNLHLVPDQQAPVDKPAKQSELGGNQLEWLRQTHPFFARAESQVLAAQADTERSRRENTGTMVKS